MKASNDNYFVELSKVNVNEHIEHKGNFSYPRVIRSLEKRRTA